MDIKTSALGTGDRWLEIAGCGMVDPAVLEAVNTKRGDRAFDPEKFHATKRLNSVAFLRNSNELRSKRLRNHCLVERS